MNSVTQPSDNGQVQLQPRCVPDWPQLAWVAKFAAGSTTVTVLHGPRVEIHPQWIAEAVWTGPFSDGDFDRTDLVFGTGIRVRGNNVQFVASGTTTDRLWHCEREGWYYVANSLPAILAAAGIGLLLDHHYFTDIRTITGGLTDYRRTIPTDSGDLHVQYFHNLQYDGSRICEVEKPDSAPHFESFEDYHSFLVGTAKSLEKNASDADRHHQVKPLTSISSGYDASATAVIARHAGCKDAVTIRQSASYWRGSDSGEEIARYLNLSCHAYDLRASDYPHEAAVWSVSGRAGILNWTQFDYPEPLCLFFSGCRGDMVWDRTDREPPDPYCVPSVSDLGLCEFRLLRGVFHCVVPSWGARHVREIRAIAHRPEMRRWTMGGKYDRPIARRIVEQAGVPRGKFAVQKKNTSTESYFLWPNSRDARDSFLCFLRDHGVYVPPAWLVRILRPIVTADRLIYLNFTGKYGLWDPALRIRLRLRANRLLFHWSNHELKERYRRALTNGRYVDGGEETSESILATPTRGVAE